MSKIQNIFLKKYQIIYAKCSMQIYEVFSKYLRIITNDLNTSKYIANELIFKNNCKFNQNLANFHIFIKHT